LQIATERIGVSDPVEIGIESEHVQHGNVGTDRDPHSAALDAPERHHGHAGALGNEFRRQAAAEPRRTDALPETSKAALDRGKQRCDTLCHANILAQHGSYR